MLEGAIQAERESQEHVPRLLPASRLLAVDVGEVRMDPVWPRPRFSVTHRARESPCPHK
jgi:hypothetical protein